MIKKKKKKIPVTGNQNIRGIQNEELLNEINKKKYIFRYQYFNPMLKLKFLPSGTKSNSISNIFDRLIVFKTFFVTDFFFFFKQAPFLKLHFWYLWQTFF